MARIRKSAADAASLSSRNVPWLVAVYIRLSREDGNDESFSVVNQQKIIEEYLETWFEGDFQIVGYYIDG